MYVYMYIYIYIYVCVCICKYKNGAFSATRAPPVTLRTRPPRKPIHNVL